MNLVQRTVFVIVTLRSLAFSTGSLRLCLLLQPFQQNYPQLVNNFNDARKYHYVLCDFTVFHIIVKFIHVYHKHWLKWKCRGGVLYIQTPHVSGRGPVTI